MFLLRRFSASKIFQKHWLDVGKVTKNRTFNLYRGRKLITHGKNCSDALGVNRAPFRYSTQATGYSTDVTENEDKDGLDMEPEPEYDMETMFEEIALGDPEILKQLKLIQFEIAVLREEHVDVPDVLNKQHLLELLNMNSPSQRKKYLTFIRLNEYKAMRSEQKKINVNNLRRKWKEEQGFHYYGLSGHTLFMRIYEKSLQKMLMQRHERADLEIVLDCSYQKYMTNMNVRLCAKQIFYCLYTSRRHRSINKLKLCNFNESDQLGQIMPSYFQTFYKEEYCSIHKESYLDLYPRERLVYLSPHAAHELEEIDHNDVYIIGAFVDRGTGERLSLAKAKEQNIRMAKFPIDQYLYWRQGSKCLPINQVIEIILNMSFYKDWNKAFKAVPPKNLT